MKNEENNKELDSQPTDKEKQAHSNEGNEKIAQPMKKINQRIKTRLQN